MAVPKKKTSPSRRGMRRSHMALENPQFSVDKNTNQKHKRHNLLPDGTYRGKQIVVLKVKDKNNDENTAG